MRSVKVIAGVAVALVLLVVGGTWVHLNVLRDDAPERLALTPEPAESLPTVFSEWGIPDPPNVAASVGDEGLLELLLVMERV